MQCLLEPDGGRAASAASGRRDPGARVTAHLRFLQLQVRSVEELRGEDYLPVDELVVDGTSVLSWQEAFECEIALPVLDLDTAFDGGTQGAVESPVAVPADEQVEPILDSTGTTVGRIVRRRSALAAAVSIGAEPDDGYVRLTVAVENTHPDEATQQGRRDPALVDRRPRAARGGGGTLRLPAGALRRGHGARSAVPPGAVLPGARRASRLDRRGAGLPDHPLRLPGDRRGERRRPVRLHGDRRDPHPARDDDDRCGEGRGPCHRSPRRGDHRPLRRDADRDTAAAARRAA